LTLEPRKGDAGAATDARERLPPLPKQRVRDALSSFSEAKIPALILHDCVVGVVHASFDHVDAHRRHHLSHESPRRRPKSAAAVDRFQDHFADFLRYRSCNRSTTANAGLGLIGHIASAIRAFDKGHHCLPSRRKSKQADNASLATTEFVGEAWPHQRPARVSLWPDRGQRLGFSSNHVGLAVRSGLTAGGAPADLMWQLRQSRPGSDPSARLYPWGVSISRKKSDVGGSQGRLRTGRPTTCAIRSATLSRSSTLWISFSIAARSTGWRTPVAATRWSRRPCDQAKTVSECSTSLLPLNSCGRR